MNREMPTSVEAANRPPRWLMIGAVIASLSGAAVYQWVTRPLPHPKDCSPKQLNRWVALHDLSEQPQEFLVELADRFATILVNSNRTLNLNEVDPKYRQTVAHNRDILLAAWLRHQATELQSETEEDQAIRLSRTLGILRTLATSADIESDSVELPALGSMTDTEVVFFQRLAIHWLESTALEQWAPDRLQALMKRVDSIATAAIPKLPANESASEPATRTAHQLKLEEDAQHRLGLLIRAWLMNQAEIHNTLDPPAKADFVNCQYAHCKEISELILGTAPRANLSTLSRLARWLQPNERNTDANDSSPNSSVSPEEEKRLQAFVAALGRAWLADSLRPRP